MRLNNSQEQHDAREIAARYVYNYRYEPPGHGCVGIPVVSQRMQKCVHRKSKASSHIPPPGNRHHWVDKPQIIFQGGICDMNAGSRSLDIAKKLCQLLNCVEIRLI